MANHSINRYPDEKWLITTAPNRVQSIRQCLMEARYFRNYKNEDESGRISTTSSTAERRNTARQAEMKKEMLERQRENLDEWIQFWLDPGREGVIDYFA